MSIVTVLFIRKKVTIQGLTVIDLVYLSLPSVSCNHKQTYGDTYGITLYFACGTQKSKQMAQNADTYVPNMVTYV